MSFYAAEVQELASMVGDRVRRIAQSHKEEIARRDRRIKFLEGQCDLLAKRIDEMEAEKRTKESNPSPSGQRMEIEAR